MNEVKITVSATDEGAKAALGGIKDGLVSAEAQGKLAADTIANVGASVSAFAAKAVAAGDEILSTSQKMGVSTDALQEMRFWADQGGVSQQALERAVATLNQRVGEAAAGNQQYAKSFEDLGVEVTDAAGNIRSTELVMADTITALREIEDPAARAAAAADLFGTRMGRELLPALDASQMSMEEAAARAHELGIVMDGEAVAASDKFADSLSALQQTGAAVLRDFLIPIISFLADHILPAVTDVAAGFRDLPGPVQAVASVVGILSVGMLLLAPRILAARGALIAFGLSARAANLALGAIGIALVALTGMIGAFGDSQSDSAGSVQELTSTLDRQTGAFTEQTKEIIANRLERAGLLSQAEQIGVSSSDLVDAILGEEDAFNRVSAAIENAKVNFVGVNDGIVLNQEGLERLRGEVDESQASWERQSEAVEGATEANYGHLESMQAVADELRAQVDPAYAFIKAAEDLATAQDAVREAEEEHSRNSPEYRQALRDETEAGLDLLAAAGELGDEFTGRLSDAQKQMLRDANVSEEAIEQLERDLRNTRDRAADLDGARVRINVDLEAERRLRLIRLGIDNIPRNVDVNVNINQAGTLPGTGGFGSIAHAHGGIVGSAASGGPRGNRVLVGEQGPEYVDLAPGSNVHTAGATQAMLAGAGGGIVEVRITVDGHSSDRAAAFVKYVVENGLRTDGSFRASVQDSVTQ